MSVDPHQPLRDDVRLLGEVLGRVLRHHEGDEIFERVEQVREAAKKARTLDSELEHIDRLLRDMPMASALTVARAFAHFLTLANIAEQHHRVYRRRDHARDPAGHPQRGSAAETFARLRQAGVPADALAASILSMRVELVFTAHPTEIVRRTLLQKHNRIADILAFRDRPDLTPDEQEESLADLSGRSRPRGKPTKYAASESPRSTKCGRASLYSNRACGMRCRSIYGRSTVR